MQEDSLLLSHWGSPNINLLWFKNLVCAFKIILINRDIKKLIMNTHHSIVCVKVGGVKLIYKIVNYFTSKLGLFGNSRNLQFGIGKLWWNIGKSREQRWGELPLLSLRQKLGRVVLNKSWLGEIKSLRLWRFLIDCRPWLKEQDQILMWSMYSLRPEEKQYSYLPSICVLQKQYVLEWYSLQSYPTPF